MSKVSMKIPQEFELALSYCNLLGEHYFSLYDSCESSSNEKVDIVSPAKSNIVISMEETKKAPLLCSVSGNNKQQVDNSNNSSGNSSTKETVIESVMRTVEKCIIN